MGTSSFTFFSHAYYVAQCLTLAKTIVYVLALWFYSSNKSSSSICGALYGLESALT